MNILKLAVIFVGIVIYSCTCQAQDSTGQGMVNDPTVKHLYRDTSQLKIYKDTNHIILYPDTNHLKLYPDTNHIKLFPDTNQVKPYIDTTLRHNYQGSSDNNPHLGNYIPPMYYLPAIIYNSKYSTYIRLSLLTVLLYN
jgi:hypothetical protein